MADARVSDPVGLSTKWYRAGTFHGPWMTLRPGVGGMVFRGPYDADLAAFVYSPDGMPMDDEQMIPLNEIDWNAPQDFQHFEVGGGVPIHRQFFIRRQVAYDDDWWLVFVDLPPVQAPAPSSTAASGAESPE